MPHSGRANQLQLSMLHPLHHPRYEMIEVVCVDVGPCTHVQAARAGTGLSPLLQDIQKVTGNWFQSCQNQNCCPQLTNISKFSSSRVCAGCFARARNLHFFYVLHTTTTTHVQTERGPMTDAQGTDSLDITGTSVRGRLNESIFGIL